jgi:CubicO group peptidase (beta-lactamase class C family)
MEKSKSNLCLKPTLRFFVLACALMFVIGGSYAQNILDPGWTDIVNEMRPVVEDTLDRSGVEGVIIALVDGDKVVWTEGFGFSDKEKGKKADADTMFEIGSVSKTFTGLMVMQLAEQGKLDIDRPVTDYLPTFSLGPPAIDFPRSDKPIRVRDLMTHLSGIPGDLFNGAFATYIDPDPIKTLLTWLAKDTATYPPQYRFSYSNTAVALLQGVIEAATGRGFEEYSNAFLASLGMSPASFYKTNPELMARFSKSYSEGELVPVVFVNIPASGSIVASANQMSQYLKMLIGKGSVDGRRILKPETIDTMTTAQNADIALDFSFKMGISYLLSDPDLDWAGRLMWHNGETIAFWTHMAVLPDLGLGVFVSANSTEGGPVVESLAKGILLAALEEKRGLTRQENTNSEKGNAAKAQVPERISLPIAMLKNFEGIYVGDDFGQYHILKAVADGLDWTVVTSAASEGRKNAGILYPWTDGKFRTSLEKNYNFEFSEVSGRFIMVLNQGPLTLAYGERYRPRPIPEAWRLRVGTWESADKASLEAMENILITPELNFSISDGLLRMERSGKILVLDPVSDRTAAVRGLGRIGGSAAHSVVEEGKEKIRFMMEVYSRAGK